MGGSRIMLRGEYDIWRRDELRAVLEALDLTGDVTLDLSEVTLIDAGAASLLIALHRRLRVHDPQARIILVNAQRIVRRVLELCKASDLFVFTTQR